MYIDYFDFTGCLCFSFIDSKAGTWILDATLQRTICPLQSMVTSFVIRVVCLMALKCDSCSLVKAMTVP